MKPGPVPCATVRPDTRRTQIDEALFHSSLTYPRTPAWGNYVNQLLDLRSSMSRTYNLDEIQQAFKQITGDPSSGTTKELIDAIVAQLSADPAQERTDPAQERTTQERTGPASKREATTLH